MWVGRSAAIRLAAAAGQAAAERIGLKLARSVRRNWVLKQCILLRILRMPLESSQRRISGERAANFSGSADGSER